MSKKPLVDIEILNSIAKVSSQYGDSAVNPRKIALIEAFVLSQGMEGLSVEGVEKFSPSEIEVIKSLETSLHSLPEVQPELLHKIEGVIDDHIRSGWVHRSISLTKIAVPTLILLLLLFLGAKYLFFPPKWKATFFNNRSLSGPPFDTKKERELNYNWALEAPLAGMSPNNFSAKFETLLTVKEEGQYTFTTVADDGVRVFVDDEKVLDFWIPQDSVYRETSKILKKGEHRVRVEYYEGEGNAKISMEIKGDKGNNISLSLPD